MLFPFFSITPSVRYHYKTITCKNSALQTVTLKKGRKKNIPVLSLSLMLQETTLIVAPAGAAGTVAAEAIFAPSASLVIFVPFGLRSRTG